MLNRNLTSALAGSVLALGLGFTGSAAATVIVDQNGPSDNLTVTTQCLTSEVSLSSANSDACAGYYALDNYGDQTELDRLNAVTNDPDWTSIGRAENSGGSASKIFEGIRITLSNVSVGSNSGSWTISWEDTDNTAPLNLPITIDIAAGFKGGNQNQGAGIAYFFFNDEILTVNPTTRTGAFDLQVTPELSHESLWVRLSNGGGPPT